MSRTHPSFGQESQIQKEVKICQNKLTEKEEKITKLETKNNYLKHQLDDKDR